jgi:dolichol-phosphate mannosyltransferase
VAASSSVAAGIPEPSPPFASISADAIAELTIVVPTLNERENIVPFLQKVESVLQETRWEVIFVDDDSGDGTADAVRAIARRDPRVRCLQRLGRRGLSTACIEGILACSSPYIAVMDADMQHDERLLPQMLEAVKNEAYDVAIGSRYIPGGGVGNWDAGRASISEFATRLSRAICRVSIADPMSGFFMIRRDVFEDSMRRLSGQGFKILLDLMASAPRALRVKELPYQFRVRQHGASKLDTLVAWEFVMLLVDKLIGGKLASSSLLMTLVITLSVAVHLGVRGLASLCGAGISAAGMIAIAASAVVLFFLNQLFTRHDQRLSGGRLILYLVVIIMFTLAIGNFEIDAMARLFNESRDSWSSSILGGFVSTVSSYAVVMMVSRLPRWKRGSKSLPASLRYGDRSV